MFRVVILLGVGCFLMVDFVVWVVNVAFTWFGGC